MKKEIFSVGGGIVCYQMGIIKWILENIDQVIFDKNVFLEELSWISSVILLVCCLHGIGNIDSWFRNYS